MSASTVIIIIVVVFGFLFCVGMGIFAFGYMNKTSQIGTFIFGSMKSKTKVYIDDQPVRYAEQGESNHHLAETASSNLTNSAILSVVANEDSRPQN